MKMATGSGKTSVMAMLIAYAAYAAYVAVEAVRGSDKVLIILS
jgi:hypothetical protein